MTIITVNHITKVDLCNWSLDLVGAALISSFEENTLSAAACKRLYSQVLSAMLRSYPWNFATLEQNLPHILDSGKTGSSYFYQIPHYPYACLRVLSLENHLGQKLSDWEVLKYKDDDFSVRNVIAYKSKIVLRGRCLVYVENPDSMDSLFRKAFAYELAKNLALRLSDSSERLSWLTLEAEKNLKEARRMDAQERSNTSQVYQSSWLNSVGEAYD